MLLVVVILPGADAVVGDVWVPLSSSVRDRSASREFSSILVPSYPSEADVVVVVGAQAVAVAVSIALGGFCFCGFSGLLSVSMSAKSASMSRSSPMLSFCLGYRNKNVLCTEHPGF